MNETKQSAIDNLALFLHRLLQIRFTKNLIFIAADEN